MITIATPEDIRRAAGIANGFANKGVNEDAFIEWWSKMIRSGNAIVFYRESEGVMKEAIGVLVFDSPLTGKKSAAVSFWYYDDKDTSLARGLLFARAYDFLKLSGVKMLHASSNLDERFSTVHNFLTGSGFRANEMQYVKEIA